ncbi:MAG: glycoside hydrolase family 15 protein, partial [Steroidobacter sp.]
MKADSHSTLDLGIIGNCQISALIDRAGRYVWACMPRPDGDPVFCSLLRGDADDDQQGMFSVELEGATRFEQSYERNTAVLETLVTNDQGAGIRIIDFCPRFRQFGRNFRPVMMIRIVEPVKGHPVIHIKFRPLADYGSQRMAHYVGSHHIRYENATGSFRVSTNLSLNAIIEERAVVLHEPACFILGNDEPVTENPRTLATRFLDETRRYWQDWIRELAIPFEWQQAVIRSAITLKLCSFEDTGAVVAALTTSIPESANSGRNWDYRFCWLRDSYFTIHALNRLGATRTMEGYLRYISNVFATSRGASLQPVYGISGETELAENIVESLAGYRGMGPVRIGNQAYEQMQHDMYGAVILATTQSFFDERLSTPAGLPM